MDQPFGLTTSNKKGKTVFSDMAILPGMNRLTAHPSSYTSFDYEAEKFLDDVFGEEETSGKEVPEVQEETIIQTYEEIDKIGLRGRNGEAYKLLIEQRSIYFSEKM